MLGLYYPNLNPWTARRSNLSILKKINTEYSLEGLVAEAEAPIVWPPDSKTQLIGKDPAAGKGWKQTEKGGWDGRMASPTRWTWIWIKPRAVKDKGAWHAAVHGWQRVRHHLTTEQQQQIWEARLPMWKSTLLNSLNYIIKITLRTLKRTCRRNCQLEEEAAVRRHS